MFPKKKLCWLFIALDILLVGGLLGAGWEYAARRTELGDRRQQMAELEASRQTLATKQAALAATASERAKLNAYFLNPEDLSLFIEELEKLATSTGVTANLTTAKIDGQTKPVAHFTLELGGDYAQIFQYLQLLENLPFVVTVRQAQLDAISTNPGKPTSWRANLTLDLNSLLENKYENSE